MEEDEGNLPESDKETGSKAGRGRGYRTARSCPSGTRDRRRREGKGPGVPGRGPVPQRCPHLYHSSPRS